MDVRRTNDDLRDVNEQLLISGLREQEVAADLTAFLSRVSHEMVTPLTALQLLLDRLKTSTQQPVPDEEHEIQARETKLALMQAQVRRLAALVGDLGDVTRAASGRLRLTLEAVDVGTIAVQAVETVRALATAHAEQQGTAPHVFTLERTPDALVVQGDAGRLDQVLLNLLTNALKYTPGGTRITVGTARTESEAVLTVQDEGPGIKTEAIPTLFNRFNRPEQDAPARGSGIGLGLDLGLGLYICHELVTAHGGRIAVHSVLGQGATFRVSLPLVHPQQPDPPPDLPPPD